MGSRDNMRHSYCRRIITRVSSYDETKMINIRRTISVHVAFNTFVYMNIESGIFDSCRFRERISNVLQFVALKTSNLR